MKRVACAMDKFIKRKKMSNDINDSDDDSECEAQHVLSQKKKGQKLRKYDYEYIKLGFIECPSNVTKPQCLVCYKT